MQAQPDKRHRHMRILRFVIGLSGTLLASTHLLANEAVRKSSETPAIGTLQQEDYKSLPYICECEFYWGPINGANTVFATRRERTVGFVMLDGQLVTLQRNGKPNNASCRKNARTRERWVGGPTAVALDLHATGPGEESCWFKGRMSVAVGGRTTSVNISGACGC
jgi:hypothetical protein